MVTVQVKRKVCLSSDNPDQPSVTFEAGETYEVTEEIAQALGDDLELVKSKAQKAPKNKMVTDEDTQTKEENPEESVTEPA